MGSVQAAVDVVGLNPNSTTATFSNNVSPSKPTVKFLISFNIALYYPIILHDVVIPDTHTRHASRYEQNLPVWHQAASLDCVPSQN